MELKTKKYELWEYGNGHYRASVADKTLARRVNKILKQYENYTFEEGDEPIFKFTDGELALVLKALKVSNA